MQIPDFYFAYDYSKERNNASVLCRFLHGEFERFDRKRLEWVEDRELCRIFIGEDIYYNRITEKEALRLIEGWSSANAK